MKMQVLGMLNYESGYQHLPMQNKNGLSWRVHILPFVEENQLYERFHLDEPWDSPHNIQLLSEMPSIYVCPSVDLQPGYTVYQVPYSVVAPTSTSQDSAKPDDGSEPIRAELTPEQSLAKESGPNAATNLPRRNLAAFDTSGEPVTFGEIIDGSSNTVALLEVDADAAVQWTKPADWEFDPTKPKRDLGNLNPNSIFVSFADGSCSQIPADIDPEEFQKFITRNGGEVVEKFWEQ